MYVIDFKYIIRIYLRKVWEKLKNSLGYAFAGFLLISIEITIFMLLFHLLFTKKIFVAIICKNNKYLGLLLRSLFSFRYAAPYVEINLFDINIWNWSIFQEKFIRYPLSGLKVLCTIWYAPIYIIGIIYIHIYISIVIHNCFLKRPERLCSFIQKHHSIVQRVSHFNWLISRNCALACN